ncbi:MAG TPA: hypothetical protein VHP63_05660, partial [candidate division Zixibacteria bacterium]|nr:hypothetical protein [candidate division Zixibacteria bacterium]
VQEITYWEKGKRFEIKDNNLAIISLLCDYLSARETNEKIHLPRELFAAGEHVNYYADQPIPGLEGEAFDNAGRFYETTPRKNAPPTFPKDFFPVQWKQ